MRRFAFLCILPLLLVSVAGCDSATDLEEVDLVGRWDVVGPLQASQDGRGLEISIQSDNNGVISGTWSLPGRPSRPAVGTKEDGEIQFTLEAYPGENPTFEGRLTSKHRMEGNFTPSIAEGEAIFRRGSIVP